MAEFNLGKFVKESGSDVRVVRKTSDVGVPAASDTEVFESRFNFFGRNKREDVVRSKEPEARYSFKEIQHQLKTLAGDPAIAPNDARVVALQKERELRLDQARKFNVVSVDNGAVGVDAKIVQIQRDARTLDEAAADISTLRPENFVYKYAPDSVAPALQQELVDVVSARLRNAKMVMGLAAMEAKFGPADPRVMAARRALEFEGWGTPPIDNLIVRYAREYEDKSGVDAARKAVKAAAGPRAAAGGAPAATVGPDTESVDDELVEAEDGGLYRVPKDKNVPEYKWLERGVEQKITPTFTRENGSLMDTYKLPDEIVLNVGPGRKARFKTAEFLTKASVSPTIADLLTKNRVALIEVFGADFMNGWAPLIEGSAKYYVGGFKNLTGDRETDVPAAMANFDFKETMAVLGDSPKIKTAMEILIELDGRNHADEKKQQKETKEFLHSEIGKKILLEYRKHLYSSANEFTHEQAMEYMAQVQTKIADYLDLDEGSVRLVRTLGLFMGFGPENKNLRDVLHKGFVVDGKKREAIVSGREKIAVGFSKIRRDRSVSEQDAIFDYAKRFDNVFQLVAWAETNKRNPETNKRNPETTLRTTLDKSKAGSDVGILAKGYTEIKAKDNKGKDSKAERVSGYEKGGIDGLIDAAKKLDNGAGMTLTINGMKSVFKSLETVEKMMKDESKAAEAKDKESFVNAVLKELVPWTQTDPPLISVDTVEMILAYVNAKKDVDHEGQLVSAANPSVHQRIAEIERKAEARYKRRGWF